MNLFNKISDFKFHLESEEKSLATIEKYTRDVSAFCRYISDRGLAKNEVIEYKKKISCEYAPASINSMLISINSFLRFLKRDDCCVKLLKIQRQIFANEDKELTKEEYRRLLNASKGTRIGLIIQTICETGIRVSELEYITVEAVNLGKTTVECKSKARVIFIPTELRKILKKYITEANVLSGSVFVSKSGKALNRCNIWRDMKSLCKKANVSTDKVFPHNLRHLFARTFYAFERDIVRLADLLGHSNINTTRIYTAENGTEHLCSLERLHKRLMT